MYIIHSSYSYSYIHSYIVLPFTASHQHTTASRSTHSPYIFGARRETHDNQTCEICYEIAREAKCVGGRSFILYEVTMKAERQNTTKTTKKLRRRPYEEAPRRSP